MWKRKVSSEMASRIKVLSSQGTPIRTIAKQLGVSKVTVVRYRNPELSRRQRDHRRVSKLTTGGRVISGLRKRPWPGECETCGRKGVRLHWHHWDDTQLNLGLWLCPICHHGADFVERGLMDKYLALKSLLGGEG